VEVPVNALITLRDPDPIALEGPSTLIDAPVTSPGLQEPVVAASVISSSLERPSIASATANLSSQETRLPEPTAASSVAAPSSDKVTPQEPTFASPAINVPPPEGTRLPEPTTSSSAVSTSLPGQVCFTPMSFSLLSALLYSLAFFQSLNLSELLAFDPASIGSAILEADDPQPDSTSVASQLLCMKDLLSGSIDALIQDSSVVKRILDEVNSQLPVGLQVKLLLAGHLPSFQVKVAEARHRIETRRSQSPLRTNIAERCQSVNKRKAAPSAKTDTSISSQRLLLLENDLEDLEAKVLATKQCIQEEKDLIASSKWEVEALTTELKVDLAELSALSK
jgi:hypothetical protein